MSYYICRKWSKQTITTKYYYHFTTQCKVTFRNIAKKRTTKQVYCQIKKIWIFAHIQPEWILVITLKIQRRQLKVIFKHCALLWLCHHHVCVSVFSPWSFDEKKAINFTRAAKNCLAKKFIQLSAILYSTVEVNLGNLSFTTYFWVLLAFGLMCIVTATDTDKVKIWCKIMWWSWWSMPWLLHQLKWLCQQLTTL